ncbi:MAG TPA: hypothetical protein VL983_03465 [Terriglobales bacterium]|nr:hypothetical protein [Terriglobales bacterium]
MRIQKHGVLRLRGSSTASMIDYAQDDNGISRIWKGRLKAAKVGSKIEGQPELVSEVHRSFSPFRALRLLNYAQDDNPE